jgi:tRNA/tmRNA/rRNA uracil-C5-methylase (TrmA/RlmC/RlmD family)
MKELKDFLNRWIKPQKKRELNRCYCGSGLITFYSKFYRECVKCSRKFDIDDGVEIRHQR